MNVASLLKSSRSGACLKTELAPALCGHYTFPIEHASLISASAGSWQFNLKYLNSATELLGDSVAQLVRAWQAIYQVTGSSPSLSHCLFSPDFDYFLSHCS